MSRPEGHVHERESGNWAIVLSVPDPTHKSGRRRIWKTVEAEDRHEAERIKGRMLDEIERGTFVEPDRQTLGQFLTAWLDHMETQVAENTYARYQQLITNQIRRHDIVGRRLQKLRPGDVQAFYGWLLREGRVDGEGGLAPRTVGHVHRCLHKALEDAVKWEQAFRNVCDSVDLPKVDEEPRPTLSIEDALALMDATRDHRYLHAPVVLALATGARRGEILGVRWSDVDLDNAQVRFLRALQDSMTFKETKGRKGRTVAIPQWAVAELKALKAEQAQRRLQMADGYRADLDLVCALEDGTPIKPNTLSWAFRDLMEDLAIRKVTYHDLRHTHASHLLNDGESLAVIQQRLGHSSITTTIDRYGHLDEGQQRQAADRLDRLMGGSREAK